MLIRYGRGSKGFSNSAAAKQTTPNTAICAMRIQRLRTIRQASATNAISTLSAITTPEIVKMCTIGSSHPGSAASNFDQTMSS